MRSYLYNSAVDCVLKTVKDTTITNKSKLQMTVNYPEVFVVIILIVVVAVFSLLLFF